MLQTALFTVLFVLFILSAPVNVMATNNIMLVDFADATPAIAMQTVDNPVMGGKSSSSCHVVAGEYLVWEGTVRIVNFLKAPGFCNLRSQGNPDLSVLENTQGIAFHIKELCQLLLSSHGNQSTKLTSYVSWHSYYIFGTSQGNGWE
jgi:hypothetical protein